MFKITDWAYAATNNGGLETKSASRYALMLAYTLYIILLGLIITLSILEPQHNLFAWQMAIGTVLGTITLLAAFYLWDRIHHKRTKQNTFVYLALFSLYGILLYVFSCIGRNSVDSLVDYAHLWNAALELSEGRDLTNTFYFMTYANNIKPMLYLSSLFRFAKLLHLRDPFYLILFISVLEVLSAVWGATVLAGNTPAERAEYRLPILLMFVFTLPIWANVQAFYTDSMSFATSVVALALFKLSLEATSIRKALLLSALSGVLTGLGMTVKITVLIPVIGGFILFCFSRRSIRYWKLAAIFILCVIATYELTSLYAGNYAIWGTAKETSEPIIDWIALGMKGNGNYESNLEYFQYVITLPSKREKAQYTLQYIWNNRSDFWNLTHLAQKFRCNFASGNLGAKDYTFKFVKAHNPLWELFSPWGKYYWRTSQLCFCYIFSIYTVYLLGAIISLYRLYQKKRLSSMKIVADLSMLGLIIFLMIWEANNRQLYNQIPIILLGAVLNIRLILTHPSRPFCR
ncbi:MAG: hypothetical protein NC543_10880 [bacterium]|nr:hypothetical protein [bacterium]MCM1374683.1 hypothetical protein [Muribaculum sp.]